MYVAKVHLVGSEMNISITYERQTNTATTVDIPNTSDLPLVCTECTLINLLYLLHNIYIYVGMSNIIRLLFLVQIVDIKNKIR